MAQEPLTGLHIVGGRPFPSGGEGFHAIDPARGAPLAPAFAEAGPEEADLALRAAEGAFAATRDILPSRWADLLEAIARAIGDLGDDLLDRAGAETALPRGRLIAERARTVNQIAMFAAIAREGSWVEAVIDRADPARKPVPKPDVRRARAAIGPVAIFDASNFPFAFGPCGGDAASALAAGNPVIVKAHPGHPGTDELFARAVLAALAATGLPAGLFALLQGRGNRIGADLVRHPATRAVAFTGSRGGGRALMDIAAARPRPISVYAEMGSINPLAVLPGAAAESAEAIAAGLAGSISLGVGQFCTKPGLVLVPRGDAGDRFVSLLGERLASTPAGTMLGKRLSDGFLEATARIASVPGVRTILPGAPSGFADVSPLLFEVDAGDWRREPSLQEEAFGPAAVVARYRDLGDLLQTIAAVGGSLTGTVHHHPSDREEDVRAVLAALAAIAGRVISGGFPTGVEVCAAMVHGGPYPATSAAGTTSVGTLAIRRFARPVAYQDVPGRLLPPALQDENPLGILRAVDGRITRDPLGGN